MLQHVFDVRTERTKGEQWPFSESLSIINLCWSAMNIHDSASIDPFLKRQVTALLLPHVQQEILDRQTYVTNDINDRCSAAHKLNYGSNNHSFCVVLCPTCRNFPYFSAIYVDTTLVGCFDCFAANPSQFVKTHLGCYLYARVSMDQLKGAIASSLLHMIGSRANTQYTHEESLI
jgi:hypothetical protein